MNHQSKREQQRSMKRVGQLTAFFNLPFLLIIPCRDCLGISESRKNRRDGPDFVITGSGINFEPAATVRSEAKPKEAATPRKASLSNQVKIYAQVNKTMNDRGIAIPDQLHVWSETIITIIPFSRSNEALSNTSLSNSSFFSYFIPNVGSIKMIGLGLFASFSNYWSYDKINE